MGLDRFGDISWQTQQREYSSLGGQKEGSEHNFDRL